MYQTPADVPPAPPTQNSWPSFEVAPRTLFAEKGIPPSRVEVSALPLASMRAIRRLTAVEAVFTTLPPVPAGLLYPGTIKYRPSADSDSAPSDVAVPDNPNAWL